MPQLLFCGGIKTKSTINLCFVWQCHLGHGNMPQEWRSAPECGNVPQNMTEHGDVPQTWWQWGCCRLIVIYLFLSSNVAPIVFLCLSCWFFWPHYGEITINLCVCWVVIKVFYFVFIFTQRQWHCWGLFYVVDFFLTILWQDGYHSWIVFLFFRVASFVIYCINLFWNLLLQFRHR